MFPNFLPLCRSLAAFIAMRTVRHLYRHHSMIYDRLFLLHNFDATSCCSLDLHTRRKRRQKRSKHVRSILMEFCNFFPSDVKSDKQATTAREIIRLVIESSEKKKIPKKLCVANNCQFSDEKISITFQFRTSQHGCKEAALSHVQGRHQRHEEHLQVIAKVLKS